MLWTQFRYTLFYTIVFLFTSRLVNFISVLLLLSLLGLYRVLKSPKCTVFYTFPISFYFWICEVWLSFTLLLYNIANMCTILRVIYCYIYLLFTLLCLYGFSQLHYIIQFYCVALLLVITFLDRLLYLFTIYWLIWYLTFSWHYSSLKYFNRTFNYILNGLHGFSLTCTAPFKNTKTTGSTDSCSSRWVHRLHYILIT